MHTEQRIGSETLERAGNEATKTMPSAGDLPSLPSEKDLSDVDINDTRDNVASPIEVEGEETIRGLLEQAGIEAKKTMSSEGDFPKQTSCFASFPSEKDLNHFDINDTRDNVSSSSEVEGEATIRGLKSEESNSYTILSESDIQHLSSAKKDEVIDIASDEIIHPSALQQGNIYYDSGTFVTKKSEGKAIVQGVVASEDDVSKQSSSFMSDSKMDAMTAQYNQKKYNAGSDNIESLPINSVWDLDETTTYCNSMEERNARHVETEEDEKQNLLLPAAFSNLSVGVGRESQAERISSAHTEEHLSQLRFSSNVERPKSSLAVAAMQGPKSINMGNPPPGFVSPISVQGLNRGTATDELDVSFSSTRSEGYLQQRSKGGRQGRQNSFRNRSTFNLRNDDFGTRQRSSANDHNQSGRSSHHVHHDNRYGPGDSVRRGILPSVVTASSTHSSSSSSYQGSRRSQKYDKQSWARNKIEDRRRGENSSAQHKPSSLSSQAESYVPPSCTNTSYITGNEKLSRDGGQYSTQSTGALKNMLPEINTNALSSSSVQIPALQDFGSGECIHTSSSSSLYSDCQSFTSMSGKRLTSFDESYSSSKQGILPKQESNDSEDHSLRAYLFEEEDGGDNFDEGSILPAEKGGFIVPVTPDSSPRTRKREWRLKMNRKLANIQVGDLDPNDVPIIVLMNEWAKTKSSKGAAMVETLLNRVQAEVRAGNTRPGIQLTTKMYTIAVDAWAKSKEGGKAARRAEAILHHMNEMHTKFGTNDDLKPTTGIFNAVVNSWAQSKDPIASERCEQILEWMDRLCKSGNLDVKPDQYTYNTVMHAYAQSGEENSAAKAQTILENMDRLYKDGLSNAKPETISYNIVINAWAKSGQKGAAQEAEQLLAKMHHMYERGDTQVKPNVVTYGAVIDSYAKCMEPGAASRGDSLLASMMEQYQRDPLKNADLRPNTHVFNTVINCWAKSLEQDAADKAEEMLVAMERMAIPGVKPDAFTYTAVIDSWAKSGYRGAAMRASELLERMESRYRAGDLALKPNNFTYNAVINSLAKSKEPGAAEKAERVLQNMVNRYKSGGENDVKPTTINFNTVLDAWAKSGGGRSSAERAERILQWMDEIHRSGNDDVKPDTITFNAVIDAWARSEDKRAPERAQQILFHMDKLNANGHANIKPDSYTYNTVLNSLAKSGCRGSGSIAENLLNVMERKYQGGDLAAKPNVRTYTTVIDAWAKSGDVHAASKAERILTSLQALYDQTNDADVKPNTHTYNAVMNACAFTRIDRDRSGALSIAFQVFDWLNTRKDIRADSYTFTIMLSVCANLIPRHDREARYLNARKLFMECRSVGQVNSFVLKKLKHTVTEEEYLSLVEYRVNSDPSNLPHSWTKNACRRRGDSVTSSKKHRGSRAKWRHKGGRN